MITKLDSKREKIKIVFSSTFLFGLLAHAYCYFNLNFSHDSVMVVQFDGDWQITIGRWLQPYYCLLRGDLYNPFLVGTLSLVYLACACYLILLVLNINNSLSIVFICGVLATNSMMTYANATYIYLSDIYMLAFLLAVAGVYVYQNYKYGFGATAILFALSLGLYQSFLQTAILLFLFLMINDLLENQNFVRVIKKGFGYLFTLIGGILLYFAGDKLILAIKNLQPVDSYNSLSNLLKLGGLRQIVQLIFGAYKYFFSYCLHPSIYNSTIIAAITISIYIYIYYVLYFIATKRAISNANIACLILLCVLLPLGGNIIYVLTGGMEHGLMIFSFFMFIVWAIHLREVRIAEKKSTIYKTLSRSRLDSVVVYGFCAIFIFNSIVFSNQIYLKKDLEFKSTYATLNRIIGRIEQLDGYVPGETPVALIGSLESSKLAMRHEYFSYDGTGTASMFAVTYYSTYITYIRNVMNYPIYLVDESSMMQLSENLQIQAMPVFPDIASCQIIDGTVIVKLSD